MGVSITTERAIRTFAGRQQLVEAIRDSPTQAQETDWLEWKSIVDLSERRWRFEIARHTLGFANRHPDRAAVNCDGCAYLVMGAEPGNVPGVVPVDAATISDIVTAYLGTHGPQWNADYVVVDGKSVLVVTVEPPKWGDPTFPLEKSYDRYASGYVFIRRGAKTTQAEAEEIRMLSERAAVSGDRFAMDLDWWDGQPGAATPVDVSDEAVEEWLRSEDRALRNYGGLPAFGNLKASLADRVVEQDDRPAHESKVEKYLTKARPLVRKLWIRRAVEKGLGQLELSIVNLTDHNYTEVNVVMEFNGEVWSAFEPRDIDIDGFPERPQPWMTVKPTPQQEILRQFMTPSRADFTKTLGLGVPNRKGFSYNDGSTTLKFAAVDVRPHHRHYIGPVHLVAGAELAGAEIEGRWYATSSNASGMARGVFVVPVAGLGP